MTEAESGVMCLQGKEHSGFPATPEAERKTPNTFFSLPEKAWTADTLTQTPSLQTVRECRIKFKQPETYVWWKLEPASCC